jgi:hypothetical protein
MSKNAMAGAVTLCGAGLCIIGGAMLMQGGQRAHAEPVSMPTDGSAVPMSASVQASGVPTVVWYQVLNAKPHPYWSSAGYDGVIFVRAWSDGTIEARVRYMIWPNADQCRTNPNSSPWQDPPYCGGGWKVVSSPTEGFRAMSDINSDEMVNSVDLAAVLSDWGDAPRAPIPPSDCPLNLINP